MDLAIGTLQEIRNHLGALRLCWMIRVVGFEIETCILLVAFGRETDVVELHFIHARLRHELGQGDVVILHLHIGGIGPDQFPILAPGFAGAMRLHREFRMCGYQVLVAEDRDPGDRMHVLGVQKADELRQIGNIVALSGSQRMIEGDIDDAVAILDIEHH